MKPYILLPLAGILASIVFSAIGVQSPAPPTVALAGLLGILAGEQILPVARRMLLGVMLKATWSKVKCRHVRPTSRRPRFDVAAKDKQPS